MSAPLTSWTSLVAHQLAAVTKVNVKENDAQSIKNAIRDSVSMENVEQLLQALEWLSLIPGCNAATDMPLPRIPSAPAAPIDLLATLLAHKLQYQPGERDMVILSHAITARPQNAQEGTHEEVHTSQLVTYGTPEGSAMSRTVGIPVALAALQVLDGKVAVRGVQGPGAEKAIYQGVLDGLVRVGLGMQDYIFLEKHVNHSVLHGGPSLSLEQTLARQMQEYGH
jgi:alpha-aminoadipic semialdehyde synthase